MHDYPYDHRTLSRILTAQAERLGARPWFHFQARTVSYAQAEEAAARLASGYRSLGVARGERVVAMMPNCPEFIFHWLALARLGAVDTPVNTAYKGEFLRHAIANVKARVMLIHERYLETLAAIAHQLPDLETLVVFSPAGPPSAPTPGLRTVSFAEVAAHAPLPASADHVPAPADPLMIIYTSGTTGPSKGVVLSHHALYCYATDSIAMRGFRAEDILYTCLPLYHVNARFLTVMVSLLNGARFALSPRFSASGFWDEIRFHGATVFTFLGGIPAMLLNQPPRVDDREHSVRAVFGGPLSPEMAQTFEARYGVKIYTGFYGMTEAIGVTYLDLAEMERLKAEGRWEAVLGMGRENKARYEVRLVDERMEEVPVGEPGEILCRPTRPFSMISEYVNMPGQTVQAFDQLWFHTGDLARKDADGYYTFLDRKKDYLRRQGENISSFEIEKVINRHPAVFECAAIGVQSALVEDELMVVLRLREGETLAPAALLEWCAPRMPAFMLPRYLRFIEGDFPRTPTNRIQKFRLREQGVTADTWERDQVRR